MTAESIPLDAGKPTLRPRVIDVTETAYTTVSALVTGDADAYLERKAGRTNLIIR